MQTNVQLPHYRPEMRDSQKPAGPQQTQENNGGPRGYGQPQAQRPQAPGPTGNGGGVKSSSVPAPAPQPGTGQPPNLYPQLTPDMLTQQLYANRNSIPPEQLIMQVYQLLQQRLPQPQEVQQLQMLPHEQMVNQLFNVPQGPAAQQQPSPVQQAVLPQQRPF